MEGNERSGTFQAISSPGSSRKLCFEVYREDPGDEVKVSMAWLLSKSRWRPQGFSPVAVDQRLVCRLFGNIRVSIYLVSLYQLKII